MSTEEGIFGLGIRAAKVYKKAQCNPLEKFTSVDFYIPSLKLCVYVDGIYWHRSDGTKARDARQTKVLEAAGFNVLRISDLEVRRLGVEGIKKLILKLKGDYQCQKAM